MKSLLYPAKGLKGMVWKDGKCFDNYPESVQQNMPLPHPQQPSFYPHLVLPLLASALGQEKEIKGIKLRKELSFCR